MQIERQDFRRAKVLKLERKNNPDQYRQSILDRGGVVFDYPSIASISELSAKSKLPIEEGEETSDTGSHGVDTISPGSHGVAVLLRIEFDVLETQGNQKGVREAEPHVLVVDASAPELAGQLFAADLHDVPALQKVVISTYQQLKSVVDIGRRSSMEKHVSPIIEQIRKTDKAAMITEYLHLPIPPQVAQFLNQTPGTFLVADKTTKPPALAAVQLQIVSKANKVVGFTIVQMQGDVNHFSRPNLKFDLSDLPVVYKQGLDLTIQALGTTDALLYQAYQLKERGRQLAASQSRSEVPSAAK